MITKKITTMLTVAALAFAGQLFAAETFYVAPNGKDTNPGTEAKPFLTLAKSRDAIRAYRKTNPLPAGGITVYLRDGEYNLGETFILTPQDSGEEGKPVVYRSYPKETARITSKKYVTGWKKVSDYPAGLPELAKGKLFEASIEKGWRPQYLFVNGVRQQIAQAQVETYYKKWPQLKANRPEAVKGRLLRFPAGALKNFPKNDDAEINMTTAMWWNIIGTLSDIDPEKSTARLHSDLTVQYNPINRWSWLDGGYYNLRNAIPLLDSANEYVVDSAAGKIYYWPADGTMDGKKTFSPSLSELVRFQGDEEEQAWKQQVHHLELRNLVFRYSDFTREHKYDPKWLTRNGESSDAMIFLQGVRDIVIDSCVIANSGSQGIALDHYAQRVFITGNEIAYNNSGGVSITGYGPGDVDLNHSHLIERNYIHHMGLDYMHSNPVQIYGSHNNKVRYNWFKEMPYAAVSIVGMKPDQMNDKEKVDTTDSYGNKQAMYQARWDELKKDRPYTHASMIAKLHVSNNLIEYNILEDWMTRMRDGGALYTWEAGQDTLWQYNVGKALNASPKGAHCIYADHGTWKNKWSNNIFWTNATGSWCKNISNNATTIIENTIVSKSKPEGYDALVNKINDYADSKGGWLNRGGSTEENVYIPVYKPKPFFGVQAEAYTRNSGTKKETSVFGAHLGYIDNGNWIMFEGIEFPEGITKCTVRVACGNNNGGTIELRLGSASGKLLGSCRVEPTGNWGNWKEMSCEVSGLSGKQDLYLVFTGKGSGMFNIDRFEFDKKVKWKK
jgi:hypothetical protein